MTMALSAMLKSMTQRTGVVDANRPSAVTMKSRSSGLNVTERMAAGSAVKPSSTKGRGVSRGASVEAERVARVQCSIGSDDDAAGWQEARTARQRHHVWPRFVVRYGKPRGKLDSSDTTTSPIGPKVKCALSTLPFATSGPFGSMAATTGVVAPGAKVCSSVAVVA